MTGPTAAYSEQTFHACGKIDIKNRLCEYEHGELA